MATVVPFKYYSDDGIRFGSLAFNNYKLTASELEPKD